ncbi:hypothetical protein BC835DRAFT_1278240 [Cytidiella melzeri]|nr:hypothetical protein BC835DRAFT_1278240 [Cytidiella melzeri]
MSSFTPLLSPAKFNPGSSPVKGKWRSWSTPICRSVLSKTLCGLLNKLATRNFDAIANRIAQLTWSIELSEDRDALEAFVRAVFHRGATEETRQVIYALLCQRVVDVLEAERSRWRKVDILHIGNPFRSFETMISLLAIDEFNRTLAANTPGELEGLMRFLGELLVHGVLVSNDVGDLLASLIDGVRHNDEHLAVVLCRFLSPITSAFNALHILGTLHVADLIKQVLKEDGLSPKVRYLMMGILERAAYPTPRDVFGSTHKRVEVYGIALDEYYDDEDGDDLDADLFSERADAEDNEWMQRDCEDWAKSYFLHHDQQHLGDIMHSLKIEHRRQLMRCLISTALYTNDITQARHIGSLYTIPRIYELCFNGQLFVDSLREELAILQDVRLDVPNASQLMAQILYSTTLDGSTLKVIVDDSMPSQTVMAGIVNNEIKRLGKQCVGTHATEEVRFNRFERTSSSSSSESCGCIC